MISSPTKLIIWSTLSTDTRIEEDSAAAFFGAALPGLLLAGDLLACAFSATGAAGFSSDAEGSAGVLGTGVAGSAAEAASSTATVVISICSGSIMKHITASISSALTPPFRVTS